MSSLSQDNSCRLPRSTDVIATHLSLNISLVRYLARERERSSLSCIQVSTSFSANEGKSTILPVDGPQLELNNEESCWYID
jgi:hypothetical protein